MTFRQFLAATALSAGLLFPAAAQAQTLRAGATVSDPDGGEVGTIVSVEGDVIVLRTDRHEVRLPASALRATETGAVAGVTRDQLNAQIDQAMAQAQQAFVVGATVRDPAGVVVGPVQEVTADTVTVQFRDRQIRLPRNALTAGDGGLVIGATVVSSRRSSALRRPARR
ncbi:MAG: hypothetical protein ACT4N8_05450 [Sphingosinicella sp.]|uniref:hypothetical protein n=1 Tax=Sphingosinicella sp. TaxID=1917971 RepID=UPI0040384EFB